MSIYLDLNKDYIEKTMKDATELGKDEYADEQEENVAIWDIDDDETEIVEIGDDGTIEVRSTSKLGDVTIGFKLAPDDEIKLIEQLVKKLNKLKTTLESLK